MTDLEKALAEWDMEHGEDGEVKNKEEVTITFSTTNSGDFAIQNNLPSTEKIAHVMAYGFINSIAEKTHRTFEEIVDDLLKLHKIMKE